MTERALVVGMSGSTGLGVVRALAGAGVECHAAHFEKDAPAMATRLAAGHVVPDWTREPDRLGPALVELARALGIDEQRPASLHVCHDAALGPVWAAADALRAGGLRCAFSFADSPDALSDKRTQMAAAVRAAVDIPWTRWGSAEELASYADECPYPVILKPVLSHIGVQVIGAKALPCADARELHAGLARIGDLEVLLQEYVPGGDDELYTAGLFACAGGHLAFTGRKLKQHPPGLGIARLAEEVGEPGLIPGGVALLRELGYQGVAQVEYKRDARDGAFRLMEANFRPWTWMGLATACGVNLPLAAHRWALAGEVPAAAAPPAAGAGRPRRWVWAIPESRYTVRDLGRGRRPQVALWRGLRAEAFFSRTDPEPFVRCLLAPVLPRLRGPRRALRRGLGGLRVLADAAALSADWARAGRRTALGGRPAIGLPPAGPILVLSPHPDDETIMCGATLAAAAGRGDALRVVAVTSGAATAVGAAAPDVSALRESEQRAACGFLGAGDPVLWEFADGRLSEQRAALARRIAAELRSWRPATIIVPFLYDVHRDHALVGLALADALDALAGAGEAPPPRVLGGAVQTVLSPAWATRLVPVGRAWGGRRAAEACYGSRPAGLFAKPAQLTRLNPARPLLRAEAFVELPASAWVALARSMEAEGLVSVRQRPAARLLATALDLSRGRERRRVTELMSAAADS